MSNTDDFELQVRRQADRRADLPGPTVTQAIQTFIESGRTHDFDVADCLISAREIAQSTSRQRTSRELPATGKARRLAAEMRSLVEESSRVVRQELFDSPAPPFRTLRQAVDWIASEAAAPRPEIDVEAVQKLRDQLREQAQQLNRMSRGASFYGVARSQDALAYQKPNSGWVHRVLVRRGTRLDTLHQACNRLQKATGIAEDALVTFVLTGGELAYSAARIEYGERNTKLPDGRWVSRDECTITIKVPDFTFQQLRELYQAWRRERRESLIDPGLTPAEQGVLEIVRELGKPPRKGTAEAGTYWRKVQRIGKRRGSHWTTVHAPMTLYRRVCKKLHGHPPTEDS